MDECGFSPSQPVKYSWTLPDRHGRLPDENLQGRRVSALAVLTPDGPEPVLHWNHAPRSLTRTDVLA